MLKEKPDLPERKKETVIKLSDDNERLEIYPYKKAFPNLYLVGKQNYTKAHGEFKLHSHADAYEIHYLVSGQQDFTVGRENYKLKGGDIFITYPYEAHGSSRKILEKAKLFWMQLRLPAPGSRFLAFTPDETRQIEKRLQNLDKRQFQGGKDIKTVFQTTVNAFLNRKYYWQIPYLRAKLSELILRILYYAAGNVTAVSSSADIKVILDYIDKNIYRQLSVTELSEYYCYSQTALQKYFRQETGMSPGEYIQRRKIKKAQHLLKDKKNTVTAVAYKLHFSSSQYFATVFKKITGLTPKEFKKKQG